MICEGIICKTCVEMDIEIIEIAVNQDHVHIFFKWCDDHFWAPSCFHGSVGKGWEVVEKYIRDQDTYEYNRDK
jgi:putative transposase